MRVPALLDFVGRPRSGVTVVGELPQDTLLLVYDDADMSSPRIQARVDGADAESVLVDRGGPLAASSPHHLECLLPDAQRASVPFLTDAAGVAWVEAARLRFDPPTVISLDTERELHHLYLRAAQTGTWSEIPSDPGDFHREAGTLLVTGDGAGELRLVHSGFVWDAGFLVTTAGRVARIRPTRSGPAVPEWLAGEAAAVTTAHLPRSASAVAWRLSFAAGGGAGEATWLPIAAGSGAIAALESKPFWAMPALRMQLWTKVVGGEEAGRRGEPGERSLRASAGPWATVAIRRGGLDACPLRSPALLEPRAVEKLPRG